MSTWHHQPPTSNETESESMATAVDPVPTADGPITHDPVGSAQPATGVGDSAEAEPAPSDELGATPTMAEADPARSEGSTARPTMADLDGLAGRLDAVDATLARLDADGPSGAPARN